MSCHMSGGMYRTMTPHSYKQCTTSLPVRTAVPILDISAALQALEAALERQPKDGDLAAQIGAALVSTHQYRRALDYYHKAVRNSPANRPLQLHLAKLLLRLKSWDAAEKVDALSDNRKTGCSIIACQITASSLLHAAMHQLRCVFPVCCPCHIGLVIQVMASLLMLNHCQTSGLLLSLHESNAWCNAWCSKCATAVARSSCAMLYQMINP